jgi:ABC-type enterochelin transport system substrate-binding protein
MRWYFKVDPAKATAAVSGLPAKDAVVEGLDSLDAAGKLALVEPRTKEAYDEIKKEATAVELTDDEARALREQWDEAISPPVAVPPEYPEITQTDRDKLSEQ